MTNEHGPLEYLGVLLLGAVIGAVLTAQFQYTFNAAGSEHQQILDAINAKVNCTLPASTVKPEIQGAAGQRLPPHFVVNESRAFLPRVFPDCHHDASQDLLCNFGKNRFYVWVTRTDSMFPTLKENSNTFLRPLNDHDKEDITWAQNKVITYSTERTLPEGAGSIIHRCIDVVNNSGCIMKGDYNEYSDGFIEKSRWTAVGENTCSPI